MFQGCFFCFLGIHRPLSAGFDLEKPLPEAGQEPEPKQQQPATLAALRRDAWSSVDATGRGSVALPDGGDWPEDSSGEELLRCFVFVFS